MREADSDGVGGVGRGRDGQAEKRADHERNLGFLRSAAPDHRLLHAARGVFVDGEAMVGGGQ